MSTRVQTDGLVRVQLQAHAFMGGSGREGKKEGGKRARY